MDKDLVIIKLNYFLDKHEVREEFWEEVNIYKKANPEYDVIAQMVKYDDPISAAFTWTESERGYYFWEDLNTEYLEWDDKKVKLVANTELARFLHEDAPVYKNYLVIDSS